MDNLPDIVGNLVGGALGGGALVAVAYRAMRDRLREDFVSKTDFQRIEDTLDVHTEKIEDLRVSSARIAASQDTQLDMLRSVVRRLNGK